MQVETLVVLTQLLLPIAIEVLYATGLLVMMIDPARSNESISFINEIISIFNWVVVVVVTQLRE